mgnify:CR=1 FL=1
MAQVIKASSIDIKNLKFSDPRKVGNNGVHVVYVNYGGGMNSLYVQPPRVDLKWDPTYYADNDENGKFTVEFALPNVGSDDQITPFHNKMKEFDELMVDKAFENRATWFKNGKKLSRETIETLYTPLIKVSTDPDTGEPNGKYPPSFKFKIVKKENKHECSVYDSKRSEYNIDEPDSDNFADLEQVLTKGSTMGVILKCNGVWLINNKFGCTFRAEQVMVTTRPSTALGRGCAYIPDDDDEVVNDVVEPVSQSDTTVVNDSGESGDDSDDDSHVEPVPDTETKKKVRRVKKAN